MFLRTIFAILVLHIVGHHSANGQNFINIPTGNPIVNITYALGEFDGEPSIMFEIRAETKGYIAFGLSNATCMSGSDVLVSFLHWSNMTLFAEDWSIYDIGGNRTKDEQQDWHVFSLQWHEGDTITVLRFFRKLDTGDPRDIVIEDKMQNLVFAIGEFPAFHFHGLQRSGNIPFNLIQGTNNGLKPFCESQDEEEMVTF